MRLSNFKYNQNLKTTVRVLRKRQTDAESFLWSRLRNRQLAKFKFRRQFPLDKYVIDFYCHEKSLAIELDGGQHNTPRQINYDIRRSNLLNKQGIKVLRFWDNEVFTNINGVLEVVLEELQK